jgi:hypothetical protein
MLTANSPAIKFRLQPKDEERVRKIGKKLGCVSKAETARRLMLERLDQIDTPPGCEDRHG